jgi:Chalcone isomerase-like
LAEQRRTVEDVLRLDQPVRLELRFLYAIGRQRLVDEWAEILQRNQPPEALPALQVELERSRAFFRDVQPGDVITLDYVPGEGGRMSFNGARVGEAVSPAFFRAALSVWIGPRPTQPSLKELLISAQSRR